MTKSNSEILREILQLAKEELNVNGSIGFTMPDGKHHIFAYVEEPSSAYIKVKPCYVIEPNKIVDGACVPIGEPATVNYNDFAELLVACAYCLEEFERDLDKVVWREANSSLCVRALSEEDLVQVEVLDELSGNSVSDMVDSPDYAWGLFVDSELVGYCTVGGADDLDMDYDEFKEWTDDSLLLSDVYVKEEHRGHGYGLRLVDEALSLYNNMGSSVFLTILDDRLSHFYEKLGFRTLDDNGTMVRDFESRALLLDEKIKEAQSLNCKGTKDIGVSRGGR